MGRYLVLPANATDYSMKQALQDPKTAERMKTFGGDRSPVYYDEKLQKTHHIHFPGGEHYRLLQHHYGTLLALPGLCVLVPVTYSICGIGSLRVLRQHDHAVVLSPLCPRFHAIQG